MGFQPDDAPPFPTVHLFFPSPTHALVLPLPFPQCACSSSSYSALVLPFSPANFLPPRHSPHKHIGWGGTGLARFLQMWEQPGQSSPAWSALCWMEKGLFPLAVDQPTGQALEGEL